jgi:hypothetical protein
MGDHVKDASKNRAECEVETLNLYSLLVNLKYLVEEGSANQLLDVLAIR